MEPDDDILKLKVGLEVPAVSNVKTTYAVQAFLGVKLEGVRTIVDK